MNILFLYENSSFTYDPYVCHPPDRLEIAPPLSILGSYI